MWQKRLGQNEAFFDLNKTRIFTVSTAIIALLAGALTLSGCSGSKKLAAFKGTGSPYYKGSGALPKGGGVWKVGTPYKIAGKKYYPKENTSYDNTGIASWYGPKFHRRKTANGEWFNMNDLTAAHPTLPMPIFAKVTNVNNGRNIIVRINDRGPYASGREIDLSRASAKALGIIARGTGKVRVQYLGKAPLDGSLWADMPKHKQRTMLARLNGDQQHFAARHPAEERDGNQRITRNGPSQQNVSAGGGENIYIQAASFSSPEHASSAKLRLQNAASAQDKLMIAKADIGGRTWYRLRMGPFKSADEARHALQQVQTAGHRGAMIVGN